MIGSDRLGETDHSHHCYVCQCLRENTIITWEKWWIWGRIYMKFSIQLPDVPSKKSENPSLPPWLQKIRYSRSAFARQSQRGVGPPSRCWDQWVGFWLSVASDRHHDAGINGSGFGWKCHQNGIKMMNNDETKDFWYWCFEYVGCATDVLFRSFHLIQAARSCSLSLGMEIESINVSRTPRTTPSTLSQEKRGHWSLEFSGFSCVKSATFINWLCDL